MISIVIPNWNGEKVLRACINSLLNQSYSEVEIIVVDNCSSDESIKILKSYSTIKVIELNYNSGFAHAVNIGISESKGEYIALLNNDTEAEVDWLKKLLEGFDFEPSIGIVTSKLINFYDRKLIDSAGDIMNIVGQAKSRGKGDLIEKWDNSELVFSATGGASIYKKEVFEQIGIFDETYYMYFEDADLCYRAQKAGFKVLYKADAIVYHMHRYSSNKRSKLLDYWLYRNFIIFYLVNTPYILFFKRLSLLKFVLVFIHTAYYLIKNNQTESVLKTFIWLALNPIRLYRLRRLRNKPIKVSTDYIDSLREDKKLKILGLRI